MNLGDLISRLEREPDPSRVVARGLTNPHSYRGIYSQLAFAPTVNVTVAAMLDDARRADGETFTGWKGGDYTMDRDTTVWLACEGTCGSDWDHPLCQWQLDEMLAVPAGEALEYESVATEPEPAPVITSCSHCLDGFTAQDVADGDVLVVCSMCAKAGRAAQPPISEALPDEPDEVRTEWGWLPPGELDVIARPAVHAAQRSVAHLGGRVVSREVRVGPWRPTTVEPELSRSAPLWLPTGDAVSRNDLARRRAADSGLDTYQHEVIDLWPACIACGIPIRHAVDIGAPGLWRECGCPGVAWTQVASRWHRHDREIQCGACGHVRSAHPGDGECKAVLRPTWAPDDECWCGHWKAADPQSEPKSGP